MPSPVSLALTSLNIPHREFTHPGSVESLEQAAQERGQVPDQVIRSILFRVGAEQFVMVLVAGAKQISWAALRKHLGQSRLTMATEDEVLRATGYQRGAVSPFGLQTPIPVLADEGVFRYDEISLGSGQRGTTIILSAEDLRRALPELVVGQFI